MRLYYVTSLSSGFKEDLIFVYIRLESLLANGFLLFLALLLLFPPVNL